MSEDFLNDIINKKREFLEKQKEAVSFDRLKENVSGASYVHRPFKAAIKKKIKVNLIAEIKRASPSKGMLCHDFDPVKIARTYQNCKAAAISVLTEHEYFHGDLLHMHNVREFVRLPVLRKDFIIDEYQIYESALSGADAILLIAAILSKEQLKQFLACASELGLECLVEVHSEDDLKKVLNTDASIIGINNRNLSTFELDVSITEKLIPLIPKGKVIVSESGIKTKGDVIHLKELDVNAVLIGEAFMSAADIASKIREIMP